MLSVGIVSILSLSDPVPVGPDRLLSPTPTHLAPSSSLQGSPLSVASTIPQPYPFLLALLKVLSLFHFPSVTEPFLAKFPRTSAMWPTGSLPLIPEAGPLTHPPTTKPSLPQTMPPALALWLEPTPNLTA